MAQITLDSSVTSRAWARNSSTHLQIWYDSSTIYQFFCTNDPVLAQTGAFYVKSTDSGATWGSRVEIFPAVAGFIDIDVYYARWHDTANDPVAHIAIHDDTGTDRGYWYNSLNLATEVLSSATGTRISPQGAGPDSGPLSLGMSASENVHVIGRNGTFGGAEHLISTDGGTTFAASGDNDFGQQVADVIQAWPDASSADADDLLAFWIDEDLDILKVSQWDDSVTTWLTATSISTSIDRSLTHGNFSTAYRRSDGHVFVIAFVDDTSPNTLKCWDVNGTASVTARTDVLTNVADTNACALQVDTDGHLYAFYGRGSGSSARVYYKISTDSGATWGSETLYSSQDEEITAIFADPSPNVAKTLPTYFSFSDTDLYIEGSAVATDTSVALAGQLTINFQLSGTLTGVTSAQPPVVVKCRPITVQKVITATLGTR